MAPLMTRTRVLLVLLLVLSVACGSKSNTAPSPPPAPPAPTRVILLEATLAYGSVNVGDQTERTFRIYNNGNAILTVTSFSTNTGGGFFVDWTGGTIAPGTSRVVTLFFRPTEPRSYSGTVTVNADHTTGTNTLPVSAAGVAPIFRLAGTGARAFDLPAYVQRVRITADYFGSSVNFAVRINGTLVTNTILGTFISNTHYENLVDIPGGNGTVQVQFAGGVQWVIEEVR
jgi:HYDIN/CFA65/VesB-like, Ig-like domain